MAEAIVGIIMGADKDLEAMAPAAEVLEEFGVPFEVRITSAHRTPDVMSEYARTAVERGLKVIIAGAGGSAHLPGMTASETPIPSTRLRTVFSARSIASPIRLWSMACRDSSTSRAR